VRGIEEEKMSLETGIDLAVLADRLLDMHLDPIPEFILLKEFKHADPASRDYQNAYERACAHPFVKEIEAAQNARGFWPPYHLHAEDMLRRCLSMGLDKDHVCLKRVSEYLQNVLNGNESWDQVEKQDNPRWWPEMFVPLASAAMLSLIDPDNPLPGFYRRRWAGFAEAAFSSGRYDPAADAAAQITHFGFRTKRTMPPFGYYNLLLLAPQNDARSLSNGTDQALVDHCMREVAHITYVYNNGLSELMPIHAHGRDSRDFPHWLRALSLVAQFKGWKKYRDEYAVWMLSQRNEAGLWVLDKKPNRFDFPLSDSWRNRKNRVIDSTIMVMRFLGGRFVV
jgi:hypothetical protein